MSRKRRLRDVFGFMRGNILVLTVNQVLGRFFRSMVMSYASLYVLVLGGESAQIGIINSLRPLAGLLMFPLSGYFTDRAGRVKLIALSGFLSGATMLIYVFAQSWEWIAVAALLQGFMVFQFPPTSAIIADSLSPSNRGIGIATMNTIASILAMFSPYIAGTILTVWGTAFGMRVIYAFLAGASVMGAMINIRYLRETSTAIPKDEKGTSVADIFRESYGGIRTMLSTLPRTVGALGIVLILGFMSNGVASPFWVVYAINEIGLSSVDWGLILLIESGVRTLLYIPAGMLVDRYSRTKFLIGSLVLSMISIPFLAFASGFIDVLLIRMVVSIANVFYMPASVALMADIVPRDMRGRVMAAFGRGSMMIGAAGGGTGGPGMGYIITIPVMVASIAGGVLYALNPDYTWFFVGGATLISIIIASLFIRDPHEAQI